MMNAALEQQLRKLALMLTFLLVLLLIWTGARLFFLSEPQSITPAPSSLAVTGVAYREASAPDQLTDLVTRPVFWRGREPHEPPVDQQELPVEIVTTPGSVNDMKLLGVYSAGPRSGIIVVHKGERRRLKVDDVIGDWTLTMLSSDGAILENGDESRVLQLEHVIPSGKAENGAKSQATKHVSRRTQRKPVTKKGD